MLRRLSMTWPYLEHISDHLAASYKDKVQLSESKGAPKTCHPAGLFLCHRFLSLFRKQQRQTKRRIPTKIVKLENTAIG
jgi:hypothetical protein